MASVPSPALPYAFSGFKTPDPQSVWDHLPFAWNSKPKGLTPESETLKKLIGAMYSEEECKKQAHSQKSTSNSIQTREDSFDKKRQKKDRNVPSNICRFFITFLYQNT